MEKAIKLRMDGNFEIIDVPKQKSLLDWLYQQIGCDCIETVYPRGLEEPYMMVMDGEVLLKDAPVINFMASWLYETQKHGHPICGTVLVMQRKWSPDGYSIVGIPEDEATQKVMDFAMMLPVAIEMIRKKMGDQLKS